MKTQYQQCTRCVMDTTDPEIHFDNNGVCNYCHAFDRQFSELPKENFRESNTFWKTIEEIKGKTKGKKFNCILGLSGGVDSSYLAYLIKETGLTPLVVHFDNGWNTEFATRNIENLVNKLGYELYTYVINWEEFKALQLSYFKASVIDLEVPTDHLIFGVLFKIAKKYKIHNIISGYNLTSEGIMPKSWLYQHKFDRANMKDIHSQFGSGLMSNLPTLGLWERLYYHKIYKFKQYHLLQTFNYNKLEAKKLLMDKFSWKDYGGKHYESVFTRFYQGYFLPVKFGIDKRKAHLSTLICAGQLTREAALVELLQPTYDLAMQEQDIEYVCKKWGIPRTEFDAIMIAPIHRHEEFKQELKLEKRVQKLIDIIKPFIPSKLRNA